jgi:hypothetical protein
MRKGGFPLLLAALFLICSFQLTAQDEEGRPVHSLAAKILFVDYAIPNGYDMGSSGWSNGLEIGYWYQASDYVSLGVPSESMAVALTG